MNRKALAAIILGLVFLVMTACNAPHQGVTVEGAMSRAAAAGDNGAAFFTVVNGGTQPDRLLSAESAVAQATELHETVNDGGVMKMLHRPEGFEIPASGRLELKPGGKHVMFMGLKGPLEAGKAIELTLNFEKAGPIKVSVPIKGM